MRHRLSFSKWLLQKEDFATSFGVKNKWVSIDHAAIERDPSLADEIFNLIHAAYKPIGGHVHFQSPADIVNAFRTGELQIVQAIDNDADPYADAINGFKQRNNSSKLTFAAAHPEKPDAKLAVAARTSQDLRLMGRYAEVSGPLAKSLLSVGVPVIENEGVARHLLSGKDIEWYGTYPDLSTLPDSAAKVFAKYNGWYTREINGKKFVKILVGMPQ